MTQTTITDPLLTLHQLFSPSFPIGAFAYSQGLETAIQDGVVSSPNDLSDWISGLIVAGSGWSDAIFLALSAKGGALDDLSDLALAMCPSAERRLETEKQGSAFAQTANALYDLNVADAPYPVAVGAVVHALGLPMKDAVRLYGFLHPVQSVRCRYAAGAIGTDGWTKNHFRFVARLRRYRGTRDFGGFG